MRVPLHVYLTAPSKEQLFPSLTFSHQGCSATVTLAGDDPLLIEARDVPAEQRHFRRIRHIEIVVHEDQIDGPLTAAIRADNRNDLVAFLASAANRVLRGIRNFGTVTNVKEVRVADFPPDDLLAEWRVDFSEDDEKWASFVKEDGLTLADVLTQRLMREHGLRRRTLSQPTAELSASAWAEIEEAVQDNLEPSPEREFLTNALEHVRVGNLRLALIEAVVCLEIVVSQFLRAYFEVTKGWSKTRIQRYLNPDITLSTRVGLLLEIVLSKDDLKAIDGDRVRAGIGWRNKAVHETGHLPEVQEKEVRQVIIAVLTLALRLGQKRDETMATPENREIAELIAGKHAVPPPAVIVLAGRIKAVRFRFFFDVAFPSEEQMRAIVPDLAAEFAARDPRFRPNEHLHVWFEQFTTVVALWTAGELKSVAKPLPAMPPIGQ